MPTDPQIRERIDAGDIHGAAKLALKELVPEIRQATAQATLDAKIADAASAFFARHPELQFTDSQAFEFGKKIGNVIRSLNLDGTSVEHWESAWTIEQAKRAPARPRQETSVPVPKPQVETQRPDDQLTAAARALIASVGGTDSFKQLVNGLSAKEMERRMRDFAFQKACEIAFPSASPSPSILTRGEFVRGSNVVRSAEYAGADIAAAQAAVAASREAHAAGFANYRPATTTETVNPHYINPMARKGATPARKAYSPAELRRFESANAARSTQPGKPRADAVREQQELEAKAKQDRWNR
jgi:hypothetical protein